MKLLLSLLFGVWVLFTFSSCGDLIHSLREESAAVDQEIERDREDREGEIYGYKPKNLAGVTANNVRSYDAPVTRSYGRSLSSLGAATSGGDSKGTSDYRRATRKDFVDSDPAENSLWEGQGQNNYLFSQNRKREVGDMVTADIEKELRREIQFQLWMTLPPEQRRLKRSPASKGADANGATDANAQGAQQANNENKTQDEKAKDAAEEAAKSNIASNGKEDDIVRMEVVENLGNGVVRLVGQKRVIYKGVARIVEVMALANSKDVDDSGKLKSSTFLDMQTQVVQ